MTPIVNQENLTVKLHRYEGAALCEEIRLPMTASPQACDFAGAKWKISCQQVKGPEGTAVSLSLELVEGKAENVALCAEVSFPAWGTDRYLVYRHRQGRRHAQRLGTLDGDLERLGGDERDAE